MNKHKRALRDFQDFTEDVLRARHRTFPDAIHRFASTMSQGTPLGDVADQLPPVDFEEWYSAQRKTVGSMVGSGRLSWPEDRSERLAMQVELIRKIASGQIGLADFSTNFLWVRNDFDANTAEFAGQIFRPFVRDFLRTAHDTPSFETGLREGKPASKDPAAQTHYYLGEVHVGDRYTAGQVGAMGPNAHAHDITFNQIWAGAAAEIDLTQLAAELGAFRAALVAEATEPEQYVAIGEVAAAETAAKTADGPKALEHLRKAGSWIWDVATKVGVGVAIGAAKTALES